MRRELLVSLLLVAAVAAVYWPVHSYPFVLLDDYSYVVENPYVRNGLTQEGMVHAFTGITVGNWHPVTMLSHMLDCQLFGAEGGGGLAPHGQPRAARGQHGPALHRAAADDGGRLAQRLGGCALWIAPLARRIGGLDLGTQGLLSALFFMLTLMAYHHYVRRPTFLRYAAVFVLLALGLMSKPMLVTVPFVLLLLDYWPLGRMGLDRGQAGHPRSGSVDSEMQEAQSAASSETLRFPAPSPQPPATSPFLTIYEPPSTVHRPAPQVPRQSQLLSRA